MTNRAGAGGAVTVSASQRIDDPGFLQVSVSDTGCGMSAATAARIFDRLYQAGQVEQSRRKGLGLHICKALVDQHGGTFGVESAPDQGSVFRFVLPVSPQLAPAA